MPICLAVYLHRIDPFVIELWRGFGIRWYGLSYVVGFVIGYLLVRRVASAGVSTLKPQNAWDLILTLAFGVVVGGRLGYVFFYRPSLLWTFYDGFPFWGVLALNEGGMASHGGILGGILACWYFARRHGHRMGYLLDLFAFGAPLGLFFGRIANFVNGELYGRPVPPGSPAMRWAVKFPQEVLQYRIEELPRLSPAVRELGVSRTAWLHTLGQLEEAAARVGVDPDQWRQGLLRHDPPPMTQELIYQVNRTLYRVIDATQARGETADAVSEALRPVLTPRHPSQLYEALLEGLVVFLVLAAVWARPRRPLVVAGVFAVSYAIVRIIGEFFRVPDEHIGFLWLNLTQGQWLSVPLLIAGLVGLAVISRRPAPRMGGWWRGHESTQPAVPGEPRA